MTSLDRMSCLVEHDIYNNYIPCMDVGCHGFRADKKKLLVCIRLSEL